jgi:AraC-like DNA-binding protein
VTTLQRHLLSEGKWVKEAIPEAGYKNRSTFNNAFKKRFKHTPGFYKK